MVELLQLDDDFLAIGKVDKNAIYFSYLHSKHYTFIGNNTSTLVLGKTDNLPTATLKASRFSRKVGSRLYNHEKEKLWEIDISPFLKENN